MRALVFLILCLPAFAGETWTLYKGTTIVKPRVDYVSLDACSAAVPKKASGSYTCRAIVPVPIEPTPTEVHMHAGIDVGFTGWPLPTMEFKTGPFLTAGNAIPPLSVPGDEGAFRTMCGWTLMAYHDPIVFPGQVGAAHHHTFYGNVNVGAGTTADNIRTGSSSCRGGTVNLTAYWHPSLIDTATAKPLAPRPLIVYYKTGWAPYMAATQSPIEPLPKGLRMVVGDGAASGPYDTNTSAFSCLVNPLGSNATERAQGQTIPTCVVGEFLRWKINFRQCWNGQLDSPDHKSHLTDPVRQSGLTPGYDPYHPMVCPDTHPRLLPIITYIAQWEIAAGTDYSKLRLASDTYSGPAGYTAHADWFNGWDPAISDIWGANCMVTRRDCGSATLGDGRNLGEWSGN